MTDAEFQALLARLVAKDDTAAAAVVGSLYARVVAVVRPRIGQRFAAKVSPDSVANSAFGSFFRRHADDPYPVRDLEELRRLVTSIALTKCLNRIRAFRQQGRDAAREEPREPFELLARQPGPEFVLNEGDAIEFDADAPHSYRNAAKSETVAYVVTFHANPIAA